MSALELGEDFRRQLNNCEKIVKIFVFFFLFVGIIVLFLSLDFSQNNTTHPFKASGNAEIF